jgi:TonB family protein
MRSLLRAPRLEPVLTASSSPNFMQQSARCEPAKLILPKDSIYPAIAKESLLSGSVEVHFRISRDGNVYDVKAVRGSPILARAAVDAVQAWCYEPARLNGDPIDSQASTHFDFKLT